MKVENEEVIFDNVVTYNVLPKTPVDKFKPADTTPSVLNINLWIANNSGAVTITQFDDGADGQRIVILGDGFTSVANNAKIKTSTGAAKLLAANSIYRFTYILNVWYEDVDLQATPASGEANTSSNDGLTGIGLVLAKVGVNLPFKSITAGANITLTDDVANKSIIIASTGGGGGGVSKTMLLVRG